MRRLSLRDGTLTTASWNRWEPQFAVRGEECKASPPEDEGVYIRHTRPRITGGVTQQSEVHRRKMVTLTGFEPVYPP